MKDEKTTKNVKKFLNRMDKRPYPFNRPEAIVAQACSPTSGLSDEEVVMVAKKNNYK